MKKFGEFYEEFLESTAFKEYEDGSSITEVTRDEYHTYTSVEGIEYESSDNEERIVDVSEISHTEGNEFYEDQVDRYVEYIRDGGILESFPVQYSDDTPERLDDKMDYINAYNADEPSDENFDRLYEVSKYIGIEYTETGEMVESYWDYWDDWKDLNESDFVNDDAEEYWTEEELVIFKKLKRFVAFVEKYFKDGVDRIEDYALTDMNHRFKAVLELGISKVLVELV